MKTNTRKLFIATTVILMLIGAGLAVYHAYLRPEALRLRVQQTLEAKLNRKVVIKSFEFDLFNRPRVTLEEVDFSSDGAVKMQAEALVARFSLRYLLLGRLEIKDVWLKHPLFTIDVEKLSEQGGLPELPLIRTTDGRARVLYKGQTLQVENLNARFGNDRISIKGDMQGGTVAMWAMKRSEAWQGGAIVHGLRLDGLYDGLEGSLNLAVEFKNQSQGYEFTLNGGMQALGLPWGVHVPTVGFRLSAQGNSHMLDFRTVALECPLMSVRGTARLSGFKNGTDAVLDLKLHSDEFDYDAVVGALPTRRFPAWLETLLTRQIRGGRSRFRDFQYKGRVSEMGRWDTCIKNMEVVQILSGQSFAVADGERVSGVTGTAVLRHGTIDLQGLSGLMNGARIKMVGIKFPDIPRRGFRVAVTVDVDMPAADLLMAWRACVSPPTMRALLDPIGKVDGGTVRGAVSIFYENVENKAVLSGGISLDDVGLTWDKISIRHLNGTGSAPDYDAPLEFQLACDWNSTVVESLKASLKEPLGRQDFSFMLQARGLPTGESFRLDQDASIMLRGQGSWPNLQGDLEIRSREVSLFDRRISLKSGPVTGKGRLNAQIAPALTIEIPDLAVGAGTDTIHAKIDIKGATTAVGVTGSVRLADLKTAGQDTPIPDDGGLDVRVRIDMDEQVRASGSLKLRQAKFVYKDQPLVLNGLLSFDQDKVATQDLSIRQNRTAADVKGTLNLGKVPLLEAAVTIDRLAISSSSRGDSSWLKRFTGKSSLKLTNFTYYGIPISQGTAMAEVGPWGLRLNDMDFSGKGGTVKGSTIISPEGLFSYQLDLDVKDTPVADFIKSAWPETPPWMDGAMDLKGRIWGNEKAANGDVVFKARQGRIQRYNLLSKIFSVLNPYKMIKTREIDLLSSGFAYNRIMATFKIRDSVVQFDDFYVDSNSLQISAVGRYQMLTNHLDAVLGVEPLESFDKTISQIPIVGWVLTGEKGSLIVVSLRARGPIDDVSVKYLPADTIAKPVEESLLRILKLPLDLVTKPGEVILPGVLKDNGQGKP
jgi:hypothetical protein